MSKKVLLLGILAEKAGNAVVNVDGVSTMNMLKQTMEETYPFLKNIQYVSAVNHKIIRDDIDINDNDEIAMMPPFAGG